VAITHVNTQSDTGTANVGSVTLTKPTGTTTDDVLVAFIVANETGITPPSGWTLVDSQDAGANIFRVSVYRKVATGSEASSYTFTNGDALAPMCGFMSCYRGVDTTTPVNTFAFSLTTTADPVTGPNLTTTASCMILHFRAVRDDSATIPTFTASVTNERFDGGNHGASTSYAGAMYDAGSETAAGSVSGTSIDVTGTPTDGLSYTIALKSGVPNTNAAAESAVADAAAQGPTATTVAWTTPEAPATGTAHDPTLSLGAQPVPGTASASATGQDAFVGRGVIPDQADATGTAYGPTLTETSNAAAVDAAASGAAYGITVDGGSGAGQAAASGTANNPTTTTGAPTDDADASAVANDPTVTLLQNTATDWAAVNASASGVLIDVGPEPDFSSDATATAYNASILVGAPASEAVASGTAYGPTLVLVQSTQTGQAAATGTADGIQPDITVSIGLADVSASASTASVAVGAPVGSADASASAQDPFIPLAGQPVPGFAAPVGTAYSASVAVGMKPEAAVAAAVAPNAYSFLGTPFYRTHFWELETRRLIVDDEARLYQLPAETRIIAIGWDDA